MKTVYFIYLIGALTVACLTQTSHAAYVASHARDEVWTCTFPGNLELSATNEGERWGGREDYEGHLHFNFPGLQRPSKRIY